MTIMQQMWRYWSAARNANCKIREWRISDHQARQLALEQTYLTTRTFPEVYDSILSGNTRMFGARITVK